ATVPREPDSDPRIKVLLMGILGSIGMGLMLALALDRFDRHVRYPEEVTYHMGLPILGVLPQIHLSEGAVESDELSQILESLRSIRLNLLHAYGAGPMVLTVSSPGSGEGKSFVVSNLALAFADQGYRTLVVDGDIRRGTIHHLLKLERKPGLTDLLEGAVVQEDVIRHTAHERLDCVPSGTRMRNGPELLGSSAMRQFIARLRNEYDIILVDSPPLAAGVDPFVLATVTANLLLVMRTGRTERAVAHTHLDNLTRITTRVLGVVLNGISEGAVYRYYRYLPGYDSGEEEVPVKQLQSAG
ncbi:MAG TPA: polysaccharide biosynthesis tyrosine autokinase, partial [Longimicrobiales bacterium]